MSNKIINEAKFFASSVGISEMVNNYSFDELMALYLYGKNLCDSYGLNRIDVFGDTLILEMRLTLVEVAMEIKSNCKIFVSNTLGGSIHVLHNN
jgi:hypothetical protein